jgi:hypothetical protein
LIANDTDSDRRDPSVFKSAGHWNHVRRIGKRSTADGSKGGDNPGPNRGRGTAWVSWLHGGEARTLADGGHQCVTDKIRAAEVHNAQHKRGEDRHDQRELDDRPGTSVPAEAADQL